MCTQDVIAKLSLAGGLMQAGSQLNQSQYQQAALRVNEAAIRQQSVALGKETTARQAEIRQQGRQVAGSQRAALGASGVAMTGTALDLLSDTAMLNAADAEAERQRGDQEMSAARTAAGEAKSRRKSIRRYAPWEAGSTVLTSGARAYGYWNQD
jgi:hypothetical protein